MPSTLLADAIKIWQAGVEAVRPARLFADKVQLDGTSLIVDTNVLDLSQYRRLIVVGAGKASAAMAIALHEQILDRLPRELIHLRIAGWINVPAGTASRSLPNIHLHEARPAGSNSPTAAALAGTQRILELVEQADERDAVLCLLSGGGSALLVAPIDGLSVEDKQQVAAVIAAAGGNIEQLNLVRRAISAVKGGGLARRCRAGAMLSLIISDVPGDPLATIASGPTLLEAAAKPEAALQVLRDLQVIDDPRLGRVVDRLTARIGIGGALAHSPCRRIEHIILGNNADAVDAAGVKAVELGYRYVMQSARKPEGDVEEVATSATAAIEQMLRQPPHDPQAIDCWISGGEPTVRLPPDSGLGGRNQQLALSVLQRLTSGAADTSADGDGVSAARSDELSGSSIDRVAFVSGGTDGEDGPTDAAGAAIDRELWQRARQQGLQPAEFLRRADAYHFFAPIEGLIQTGPTGTNVCDLRVAIVGRNSLA